MPIYDKPMIYYPLSVLILVGIREVLVISTMRDTPAFEELLADGSDFGMHISYAVQKAHLVKPFERGELEITTLNQMYLQEKTLSVINLGRGMAWLDTSNHDDLLSASNFVQTVQKRQGIMIACPEEIAFRNGWITAKKVQELALPLAKSAYGNYLLEIINE